jgi:hypothetical protein
MTEFTEFEIVLISFYAFLAITTLAALLYFKHKWKV